MLDSDAQTVAPSATPNEPAAPVSALDQAIASDSVADYRAARQAERAGKPLDPSKPPAPEAGQPDAQAGEVAPSSEAASKPADPSGQGHKGNAETRKAELQAEIQTLLRQRAELRREVAPAQPAGEPARPASQPAPKAEGSEPQFADFEADPAKYPDPYAAFVEARAEWRANAAIERALSAERERVAKDAGERELKAKAGTMQQRIDAAVAADPTLRDRILFDQFESHVPSSLLKPGDPASPQNDLAEALLNAEKPTDLMVYLSEAPKELAALLTSPSPSAFWRTLGQIEGRMTAPKKAAPKTITDAPAPPPTVGTRHESGDDADAAVRSDDVAAYRAARLRQRTAGLR